MRLNSYANELRAHAREIRKNPGKPYHIYIIHIRQSYFSVYEGMAALLGELDLDSAVQVVAFYQQARGLVDSLADEAQPDPAIVPFDRAANETKTSPTRSTVSANLGNAWRRS